MGNSREFPEGAIPIVEIAEGPSGQPLIVGYIDEEGTHHYFETDDVAIKQHTELADESLPPLPSGRSRRFLTIEQLGKPTPIEWLVDGWIAAGELSVIYGPGDSFKSFLALHWGLEAAQAEYHVVYIAGEGAHGLRTRIPAWLRHHQVDPATLWTFRVDELPVELNSPSERAAWLAEVEDELKRRPDWVIVDTLSMCFSGDETSPHDMNNFVKGCEEIRRSSAKRTGMTVIHHTTKTGEAERGTHALRNATFSMVKVGAKASQGYSVLVQNDRMKDAEKHRPERARLALVEWDDVSSLAVESFKDATDEVLARSQSKKRKDT